MRSLMRAFSAKTKSKFQKREIIARPDRDLVRQAEDIAKELAEQKLPTLPEEAENLMSLDGLTVGRTLKMVDTAFESFFANRPINASSFNLYLKAVGEKRDAKGVLLAFEKMQLLGLPRHQGVYGNAIVALAKCHEFKKAEELIEEALQLFGSSPVIYSAALLCCVRQRNFDTAINIWTRATQVEKVKPTLEMVTAMISACHATGHVRECWERFDEIESLGLKADDVLLGMMIKICARTKSAEKAKFLWNKMSKLPNLRLTAHHYDSLILALASRPDYAQEAIDKYLEMKDSYIQPTRLTFIGLLEATAKTGDIDTAYNAIVQMNAVKITQNDQIYDGMLKTYASALSKPNLPKDLRELYFKDAWKLFDRAAEADPTNIKPPILNSLALVHINAGKLEEAEDAVIPMFEKFGLEPTGQTYQVFLRGFFDARMLVRVRSLFDNLMAKDTALLTSDALNICLDTFIRLRDVPRMIQTLDTLRESEHDPDPKLINYLVEMSNLPDEIYERIKLTKFGAKVLKNKLRTYFPVKEIDKLMQPKEKDRNRVQSSPIRGERTARLNK